MQLLWVFIGVILLAVVWALISAYGGKTVPKTDSFSEPASEPTPHFVEAPDLPRVSSWKDTTTTSVSKSFGQGGNPTGVSLDSGGIATGGAVDDEMERLRKARPFAPRATRLDLDRDSDTDQ